MLLVRHSSFPHLLRRLHEQRENGAKSKDVNKLVTVIGAFRADHAVVKDLEGAGARQLLFPTHTMI